MATTYMKNIIDKWPDFQLEIEPEPSVETFLKNDLLSLRKNIASASNFI